jgi:hypothetical protein
MAQLTPRRIFNAIYGLFSGLDSTDETTLKKFLWTKTVEIEIHDSATAGTAFTLSPLWYNDTGFDVVVKAARATAPIAVTAHAADFATFLAAKIDAAGANAVNVATFATDTVTTDNMVANVPKTMTLTAANVIVPAGFSLTANVTKTGNGVAITAATSRAKISLDLEGLV